MWLAGERRGVCASAIRWSSAESKQELVGKAGHRLSQPRAILGSEMVIRAQLLGCDIQRLAEEREHLNSLGKREIPASQLNATPGAEPQNFRRQRLVNAATADAVVHDFEETPAEWSQDFLFGLGDPAPGLAGLVRAGRGSRVRRGGCAGRGLSAAVSAASGDREEFCLGEAPVAAGRTEGVNLA
jgi:hypothetical protein